LAFFVGAGIAALGVVAALRPTREESGDEIASSGEPGGGKG